MTLVEKFDNVHDFLQENIHLAEDDFQTRKKEYSSEIMFGLLTALLKEKMIYVGEYGMGKTSLAETVASTIYKIPKESINAASLKGTPGVSIEDIVGRPDLGKLNVGEEDVIWSSFLLTQPKVVDELNRIPPDKQSILLNGMESGLWSYLNSSFTPPRGSWFGTMNYSDAGNGEVIPALNDRFDLMIEAKGPSVNTSRMLRNQGTQKITSPDLAQLYQNMVEEQNMDMLYRGIKVVRQDFKQMFEKQYGIELFEDDEIKRFNQDVDDIRISQDSEYFLDVLNAEFNSCQLYGGKRSYEECPTGCHFKDYACNKIANGLSVRTQSTINRYSKALAYLDGEDTVEPDYIAKITPYATWHKLDVKPGYVETFEEESRTSPALFESITDLVSDVHKRYLMVRDKQVEFSQHVLNDKIDEAENLANHMDHPVFNEYIK